MSRRGSCWDAVAESFFGPLKSELIYLRRFTTRAEAREAIFEFIEGYVSPVEFERKFDQQRKEEQQKAAQSDCPRDRGRLKLPSWASA